MTPEELNRTIDFIVQSQARLTAAQELDREDRVHFEKRAANLLEMQARLLESQSRRLDEHQGENRAAQKRHEELHEEFLEFMNETRRWQQEFQVDAQKRHEDALARLDQILEKPTDRMN